MGLLSQGKPLDWDETNKYSKFVRDRGISQFINIYNESKERADACFKWGDEVEYILVRFDHQKKMAQVSLKAEEVFRRISEQSKGKAGPPKSNWLPEFASYMVEGTPATPYIGDEQLLNSLCAVEDNMRFRRNEVLKVLDADETVMSLTSFPRLGCPDFTHPPAQPKPETSASGSLFFPDEAIYNGHPRFKTLVRNIRSRRKRKVIINVPIFRDSLTPQPFIETFMDHEARKASKPDHVYMDAMGFGMGCCCLQLTMQAAHLEQAKVLYDQLAPLTPIALALSAASPIYRGLLSDRDCRWDIISCSVDDRTSEESSETGELKESSFRIPKSRYDSISCYLSKRGQEYNDSPLVYDQNYYDLMVANKVDPNVARHIAHLFIRNPITLYKEMLEQDDTDLDHFENIQSTNWQTMRFKPPPSVNSPIGWRVEFRPLEAQTSDFENAAYVVFITLLSRVILAYKLNFLMPISLVDENMIEAQKRNAIGESKFWFRSDIMHRSCSNKPLGNVLENRNNASIGRQQNDSTLLTSCVPPSLIQVNFGKQTVSTSPTSLSRHTRSKPISSRHHNNNHHHHQHHHHHHHYNNHLHHLSSHGHKHSSLNFDSHRFNRLGSTANRTSPSMQPVANAVTHHGNSQVMPPNNPTSAASDDAVGRASRGLGDKDRFVKMSIDDIINGGEGFVGIMPIILHYVESLDDGSNTELITRIKRYLKLISDRASLKVRTTARLIRDFVSAHPKYNHDSVVNDEVAYDLLKMMDMIGKSESINPEFTGESIVRNSQAPMNAEDDNPSQRMRPHGCASSATCLSTRNHSNW